MAVVAAVAAGIARSPHRGSTLHLQSSLLSLKRRTPPRLKRTRQGLRVAHV
jgi:hypothetical protein